MDTATGSIVITEGTCAADRQSRQYPLAGSITYALVQGHHISKAKRTYRKAFSTSIPLQDLLRCPRLTESEAAHFLRMSAKALGNKRRHGELPRDLYVQDCKNGKVFYITEKLMEHARNQGKLLRKRK